ncbi:MAG: hypothetical protein U0I01_09745 [Pauljensenia sp.]|nr:hypothetical protein [Pauljensenia sp.]
MSNDDHPGTNTSPQAEQWVPPSGTPPIPQPASARPRARRRGRPVLLAALLCVIVVIVAVLGIRQLTQTLGGQDPHHSFTSSPTVGYSGSSTSTGSISPAWASGVETAWRIPFPSTQYGPRAITTVEGTTLYALFEDPGYATHQATVAAFDISSKQPRELWRTTGPTPESFGRPTFVSLADQFIVGSIVIDKATGAQSLAPWEGSEALAAVDGVVVACDGKQACSGWVLESSSWVRRWVTTTASQRGGLSTSATLTYPNAPVIGAGEHQSVVLRVDSPTHLAQLIDPRTGQATDAASVSPFEDRTNNVVSIMLASDGLVAFNDDVFVTYDADGFITGVHPYEKSLRRPTRDGRVPSTSELTDFLVGGLPAWSNAVVTAQTGAVALTVTPSDGSPTFDLDPANNDQYHSSPFWPSEVRASADMSVVYVESVEANTTGNRFFFDTASGVGHGSAEFHDAEDLSWAFDDLAIGVTIDGVVAFTPKAT